MIDDATIKIPILRNTASRKRCSAPDAQIVANNMYAMKLQRAGKGGGIVQLMLPLSPAAKRRIKRLARVNSLKMVIPRSHERFQDPREKLSEPFIWVGLCGIFLRENNSKRVSHKRTTILDWIVDQLKDERTQAFKFVHRHAPELIWPVNGKEQRLDRNKPILRSPSPKKRRPRSPSWWDAQLTAFRNKNRS